MSIMLIGYRGSGKTTVGRLLASRLSRAFIDSDEWIVETAGKSIRDLFAEEGEEVFRALETRVIRQIALQREQVVGLGGGSLEREENRLALRENDHLLIYLRCAPAELLRRIRGDPKTATARPNLSALGGGIAEIELLLARREPVYRQMKKLELDVTELSPEEAAAQLARWLPECGEA